MPRRQQGGDEPGPEAPHAAGRPPALPRAATVIMIVRLLLSSIIMTASTTVISLFIWTLLPFAVGWSPSVVMTGSMVPAIQPGDIVVTAPLDGDRAAVGHVLRFLDPSRPSRYLLHRVSGVNDDGTYVTRGDANQSEDSTPVQQADVTGIARLRVPLVGLPVVWLHERRFLPLALTVAGLLAAAQLFAGLRDPVTDDESPAESLPAENESAGEGDSSDEVVARSA